MTRQKARKIKINTGGRLGGRARELREFAGLFAGGRRVAVVLLLVEVERVPERAGDRPPLVVVGTYNTFARLRARRGY
jgi:hypothetical protein